MRIAKDYSGLNEDSSGLDENCARLNEDHTGLNHTPPIAEILCVKNGRAIMVCGFLMKF